MNHPANHIFQHTPESLREWCQTQKMPAFRAGQILEWVYQKRVVDADKMTSLSALDRARLRDGLALLSGDVVTRQAASDGTRKLLIQWRDAATHRGREAGDDGSHRGTEPRSEEGQEPRQPESGGLALTIAGRAGNDGVRSPRDASRQTECVMIPSEDPSGPRRTACISSQVGCPVGCKFCASGLGGLEGNLSAGRIVEQVWRLNELLMLEERNATRSASGQTALHAHDESSSRGGLETSDAQQRHDSMTRRGRVDESDPSPARRTLPRITNIVFMGMGEPLSNFAAVTHAIRTLAAPWGFHISARKITISTVGLPKAIERLASELDLPVTLALSLHAPNDELRRRLIPWAEYTTIADLLAACRKWFEKTGREITLEYTLLRGVNDLPEHAVQLAQVAKTLRANINLIRYNEVAGLEFKRPRDEDVREFQRLLDAKGINTHIRRSRGRDISAACGQLRHEKALA